MKENNNMSNNQKFNVFAQQSAMLDKNPTININCNDTLIIALEDVIFEQLGHIKLSNDDIIDVVKVINDIIMKDWWNIGWVDKCDILVK